jgi:hypothetical protein
MVQEPTWRSGHDVHVRSQSLSLWGKRYTAVYHGPAYGSTGGKLSTLSIYLHGEFTRGQ